MPSCKSLQADYQRISASLPPKESLTDLHIFTSFLLYPKTPNNNYLPMFAKFPLLFSPVSSVTSYFFHLLSISKSPCDLLISFTSPSNLLFNRGLKKPRWSSGYTLGCWCEWSGFQFPDFPSIFEI